MQTQESAPAIEHYKRDWGRTAMLYSLAIGAGIAFTIAFAPSASAAPQGPSGVEMPDPTFWIGYALDFLKRLWGFVFIAQMIAFLTYIVAFFTQSWLPSFFRAFQGDWIKKAALISVLAHPVMGFLVAGADVAKAGFNS